MRTTLRAFAGILLILPAASARAAEIEGDYIEARTADVYTGPCFSNAEVFITGHQAVMAWSVREGSWEGVDLAGLAVAAAVRGTTTFSEDDPGLARAVLIVDEKASPQQKTALVSLARHLGGTRLQNVVNVSTAPMSLTIKMAHHTATSSDADEHCLHHMPSAPEAEFRAGDLAEIATRPLNDRDHHCGNEVVAYLPLSDSVDVLPAYTVGNAFRGDGLDTNWNDPNCRSSFIGRFSY